MPPILLWLHIKCTFLSADTQVESMEWGRLFPVAFLLISCVISHASGGKLQLVVMGMHKMIHLI